VPADTTAEIGRSLPHGHVALVWAMARQLGLPALLGEASRQRDLALALIVARVLRPASKLATTRWWADTTLAADLGVQDASTDEVYAAMDWLAGRQDHIERQLARRHLEPGGLAYYDLSSSYVEGHHCELAARGYSRDQCYPPRLMRVTATLWSVRCCWHEEAPPVGGGAWSCSACRGGGQSVVTSAMAARAEDSSTMLLLVA
jgi:hypothetical protein